MEYLKNYNNGPACHLRDVLFGHCKQEFNEIKKFTPFNKNLNESQLDAISFSLSANYIFNNFI